jgi:hypothetical protein
MIEQSEAITQPPPLTQMSAVRLILMASGLYLLYALIMAVFNLWSPAMSPIVWAIFGCVSSVGYLIILVYVIRFLACPSLTVQQESLLAGTTLVMYLAVNPAIWQMVSLLRHGQGFWQAISALAEAGNQAPASPFLSLFFLSAFPYLLILAGVFFGRLIARVIKETAILVPVGIIAGLIDFWGVYWGPVNFMSNKAPMAVSAIGSAATVAARVPVTAMHHLSAPMAFIAQVAPPDSIGLGDFVFLGIFFACAYRLGFSAKRTMWGIFIGILLSCLIMAINGLTLWGHLFHIDYLPGLVFICGGLLLANLPLWKLTRQEWAMTGVLLLLILVLIGRSIAIASANQPVTASANFTVTASTVPDALASSLAHIHKAAHAPVTLRIYKVAFVYLLSPHGPQLAEWEAHVLGLPSHVTIKKSYEYYLTAKPLKAQGTWGVMEEADSPPTNILQQLKLPAHADAVAALTQLPELPPQAYSLLDGAKEAAALCQGERGFIILLAPDGGKLLSLHQQMIKILPYPRPR